MKPRKWYLAVMHLCKLLWKTCSEEIMGDIQHTRTTHCHKYNTVVCVCVQAFNFSTAACGTQYKNYNRSFE
jgi:hypothetical protein